MNQPTQDSSLQRRAGLSRRQIVRAGLSAAPVVAAVKSNTVLAGDHSCIKPSTFSSLRAANMKVSAQREIKTDYECRSHGYWKNNNYGLEDKFKTKTRFLSTTTGFTANPSGIYGGKSLQDVLQMGGGGHIALARHVVAAYLTAVAFKNDPSVVMLTTSQCKAIWNGQGVWSPFAGTTWTQAQTLAYFDTVYGPSFL